MTKAQRIPVIPVTFVALVLFTAFLVNAAPAHAESTITRPACATMDKNLYRGVSYRTYGQYVSSLQQFLHEKGYLDGAYASNAGYFGSMTFKAVARFQKAEGLPQTGYAGPLTRARINAMWCNPGTTGGISLYSISPASAPIGTTVKVTGSGFSNSNTVLIDGMVAARNVPITSSIAVACTTDPSCKGGVRQTISFTIPESLSPNCPVGSMCPMYVRLLEPGTYKLTIVNSEGATSDGLPITVTKSSSNGTLSISSLDAPTSLPIGVSGTWTLHVTAPSTTGTLHYTVTWGDEKVYTQASGFRAPDSVPQANTASFTHTYANTGTYTPTFTISDDAGHSVTANASVTITPIY